VIEFYEEVVNVAQHADSTVPVNVVPLDVYACKLVLFYVKLYSVVFFEEVQHVVEVFYANIFNPKVINNQAKLDRAPFLMP
jgi:hypothetical protein